MCKQVECLLQTKAIKFIFYCAAPSPEKLYVYILKIYGDGRKLEKNASLFCRPDTFYFTKWPRSCQTMHIMGRSGTT